MNNYFFALVLLISLILGLAAILIAYQLPKKYRLGYLSTYLYFQVFINVFGIYGIIGQVIAKKILEQQQASLQTVETIGQFFSFLGLPFLILAWYMFLRLCWEILDKAIPRKLTLGYFFALAVVFTAYGATIILANIASFNERKSAIFSSAILYLYAVLEAFVLVTGISLILSRAQSLEDEKRRKAVRLFSLISLLVYSASLALLPYSHQSGYPAAVYVLAFFSSNLLPLLFWKTYLQKSYVPPSLQTAAPKILERFLEEHKISKREEDVIRQLCTGKTNKEISKTLFISLQTVKDHIYRIYQKTDVKNRVQLINLIQSYKGEEEETPKGN